MPFHDYVVDADPGKALSGGVSNNTSRVAIKEEYGVISLFDGVSTVVPPLHKKLGYPPAVAILAEIDGSLRALVCAIGYRPDQSWGRSKSGSACLYVKDVNSLLDDSCRRLQEAVAIALGIKWIVVGGSPQEGSRDLQKGYPSVTKGASPSAKHPSKVPFTKA